MHRREVEKLLNENTNNRLLMYHPKIIENNKNVFIASRTTQAFTHVSLWIKVNSKYGKLAARASFHFALYDSFIYSRVKHEEKSKYEIKTLTGIACQFELLALYNHFWSKAPKSQCTFWWWFFSTKSTHLPRSPVGLKFSSKKCVVQYR